jgi:type I restriction-modification system DNA methylase subunit
MKATDTNIDKIKSRLEDAITKVGEEFLSSFLSAYGFANTTIKKLLAAGPDQNGRYSVKQKLLFTPPQCLSSELERFYLDAVASAKNKERFVVATNFERLIAKDMASDRGIDIPFDELPDSYEFFLPWCGRETIEQIVENPADVKAATQMGHLFESIKKDNEDNAELTEEALNVFLTRLLFCLFADDTHIFEESQFRNALQLHTSEDGSSVQAFLEGLFDVLDIPVDQRTDIKDYYEAFPYVNGGLFQKHYPIPRFSKTSRRKLLECCASDWSAINPDIFGSMFQTVISEEQRRTLGQHYTSVTNIMKVLNPLFLDDLRTELDELDALPSGKWKERKVKKYREKIAGIKVFDPACGSGNFLITAYKELCHLDMRAISMIDELPFVGIHLNNFYGIEIDDFPCEIARLSLWLAQHQINMECYEKYNNANPTLPLTASGHIVCGNALRLDWNEVCPAENDDIVYVCGNPPFAGHQTKTDSQRADIQRLFQGRIHGTTDLDYVSCWFLKGSDYIRGYKNRELGLVSTNSVTQGKHVKALWPAVLKEDEEIFFGYESFKWSNNAKDKAGVTVTIIGLRNKGDGAKRLYSSDSSKIVQNINPYLRDESSSNAVTPIHKTPDGLPKCEFGSMAQDDGNLIFSTTGKDDIVRLHLEAEPLFKKLVGADEYIKGKERWCLWIDDADVKLGLSFPELAERIEAVRNFRLASSRDITRKHASRPWAFGEQRFIPNVPAIIIPATSSERRKYVPIGYLSPDIVIPNSAFAIYDAPLWLFAILTSRMHMAWVRTVAGKLETRIRYSNTLCYNTFPFPNLSESQKKALEDSAMRIIEARENHYENTMAQLYDPDKMPDDLRAAHESNDLLVDTLYRRSGFDNDSERLQELFRRYKEATSCQR